MESYVIIITIPWLMGNTPQISVKIIVLKKRFLTYKNETFFIVC